MSPIQASKKSNQKEVNSNLQNKRQKLEANFKPGQIFRTADVESL